MLSFLCQLGNSSIVIAMTPDGYRNMVSDLQHMLIDPQCLAVEDIASWAKALKSGAIPILDLHPLNPTDRRQLLDRILELYGRAYGYKTFSTEFKESWEQCAKQCVQPSIPVRLVIRRAVDLMDSNRYDSPLG